MAAKWTAESYECWFDTPEGRFALDSEGRLLESVIAGWPRRKRTLLEIGCGTGLFLEKLWQLGFDVTGLDKNPGMIDAARKRFGDRAELFVGDGGFTPFDDNEFDYVFLWSVLEFCVAPERVLSEAARVAEKGLIIGYLNSWSLYHLLNVRNSEALAEANLFSWPEMYRMIRRNTGFRPTMSRSVLLGPLATWQDKRFYRHINSVILPPFLGAFSAIRVDFVDIKPLSPLLQWVRPMSDNLKGARKKAPATCSSEL